jgi:thiamine biosynthesis lipoprotein
MGGDQTQPRKLLSNASMSGSGQGVKGLHIIDPRTGQPVARRSNVWAVAPTAAESDALSTACMILSQDEIAVVLSRNGLWSVYTSTQNP